jgi:hypothetical protein
MIYLSGAVNPQLEALHHPRIGIMVQPRSYGVETVLRWKLQALDCGGYGGKFSPKLWLPYVDRMVDAGVDPLFVVVPDRFDPTDIAGNFKATQVMWERWSPEVLDRGLPAAWVAQNGATPDDIPPDASAVFIGGDNQWKTSERAWAVVAGARAHGLWTHLGRVNGLPKFHAGYLSCVDSADGTMVKHGAERNIPALLRMLNMTSQPHLDLFGGVA